MAGTASRFSVIALVICLFGGTWAYDNGMGATPPMGWNTWCTDDACGLIDYCTEKEIRSIADAIVDEGLDKLGYKYVNMDDCWSATTRNATGHLQPDQKNFPSGMRALADYVHSKGLGIGVYICVGTETCKRNRPGTAFKWQIDADTLADWGIDFVKADNCHKPANISEFEAYSNLSHALNATGRPILFSTCEWGNDNVQAWGGSVAQMYRIQMDHLPFWDMPTKGGGKGFGQGTKQIIEYVATLKPSTFVKQYAWMDPDFLETLFPTMGFIESRTEFTFWSLWSAPLLIATDIRNLWKDKKEIITNPEVIAINQDPLATAGDRVKNLTAGDQVWYKPLANGDLAVVLYNSNGFEKNSVTVNFNEIGWSSNTTASIRNLWTRTDVGNQTGSYTAVNLKPKDVEFLRVKKIV